MTAGGKRSTQKARPPSLGVQCHVLVHVLHCICYVGLHCSYASAGSEVYWRFENAIVQVCAGDQRFMQVVLRKPMIGGVLSGYLGLRNIGGLCRTYTILT